MFSIVKWTFFRKPLDLNLHTMHTMNKVNRYNLLTAERTICRYFGNIRLQRGKVGK